MEEMVVVMVLLLLLICYIREFSVDKSTNNWK